MNMKKKPSLQHQEKEVMEEPYGVHLLSSGYERTCPKCEELNTEIGITKTVKCSNCGEEFEVSGADHVYE